MLCAEPERGAKELEKLDQAWSGSMHPEDFYALALVLMELENSQLVDNQVRARMLRVIAWSRWMHGEVAQLLDMANQIVLLAQQTQDLAAEGEAHALLGDVLQAQGKLEAAQAEFEQALAIFHKLAEQDPSNALWQRDLEITYGHLAHANSTWAVIKNFNLKIRFAVRKLTQK